MTTSSNIILNTDSYKISMFKQYPPNTTKVFSYIESRGGEYVQTVFFGLQMFLKEYLSKKITMDMINEAEEIVNLHGYSGHFNRQGWEYILNHHNGYLPIRIKAVPEGLIIPTKNVLLTIENTDPNCFWLTTHLETSLLRSIWYPTTVATISKHCKQIIKKYLEETADSLDGLLFKLHDFAFRGVSSKESGGIGGVSHLVNFMGTDTIESLLYARKYYDCNIAGFSINASEHSTITSWGKNNEVDAYRNMLKQFGGKGNLVACVSDSYDIYNAVENIWGGILKNEVIESGGVLIIRPDSGDPKEVTLKVVNILSEKFGYTINNKGYKLLNNVRIIQGDGVNSKSIKEILQTFKENNFSADNIAFGMGAELLQKCNRDTLKFAMKCSAIQINDMWMDVYKDPITDSGKTSKKGVISLYRNKNSGKYLTERVENIDLNENEEVLQTIFLNGNILREWNFNEVRNNSNLIE